MQYVSDKGYLTVDLKQSQKGSLYFQVNTYKAPMTKPSSLSNEDASKLEQLRNNHNQKNTEITVEDFPF